MEKLEEIEEELKLNKTKKKISSGFSYGGDALVLIGASANGILTEVGYPYMGKILSLTSPFIGGGLSLSGK